MTFDAEKWAQTQPHSFFSRWPRATMTKCDFCGVYLRDHAKDVLDSADVAKHPTQAVKGGLPVVLWPLAYDPS